MLAFAAGLATRKVQMEGFAGLTPQPAAVQALGAQP